MKFLLLFLPSILCLNSVYSQISKPNEYVGALHLSNQKVISYKINFIEIGGDKIEGVSNTDFYGPNNTKTKIVGSINKKENKISFKEISNISSKSKEDKSTFCFVQVENLKIREVNGKNIIQGKFKGMYSSNKHCASGSIYLVNSSLLEDLNITTDSIKKIDSLLRYKNEGPKQLKSNDSVAIKWIGEDKIIINIWDGSSEDGDMVNIFFNGILVEKDLIITNKKKILEIPFIEEKGIIKIVALNEGREGVNTVNFSFKNGVRKIDVISNLKKEEEVFVEFYR